MTFALDPALDRPPSSPNLAAGLRAGSERALEALLCRHGSALLALARSLLRDLSGADAEDALRDAFLAADRAARTCPDDAELEMWLERFVVDACAARLAPLERDAERDERAADALLPRFGPLGTHAAARSAVRALSPAELAACVDGLPPVHRVALILADSLRLGPARTAALLGLDPSRFARRLHRSRLALVTLVERAAAGERVLAG